MSPERLKLARLCLSWKTTDLDRDLVVELVEHIGILEAQLDELHEALTAFMVTPRPSARNGNGSHK